MKFDYKKSLFNLDLLILNKTHLKQMRPVTKLNIFEPSSNNFDPDGLFSVETFGAVGSKERNDTFSYIELGTSILHPLVYEHLTTLKAFYKEVMAGNKYAIYDDKLKDLVPSDYENGKTGYAFFMSILDKLSLLDNDSDMRMFKLYMVSKYGRPEYMLKQFLVAPAGLRDYVINKSGRPEEDEINDIYRKLLSLSNTLINIKTQDKTIPAIDNIRYRIQETSLVLYKHIIGLLDGKRKFIQGKFGSRGLIYGTRNVITPSLASLKNLDDIYNSVTIDHTVIGLYQYAVAISPITMNKLHTIFINRLFSPDNNNAYLVNPKTMKTELFTIPIKERDKWLTIDGLEEVLTNIGNEDIRSEPVMVDNKYLLLIHDENDTISPVFNTELLPSDVNPKKIRPITYYELLFIALVDTFDKYRGLLTRYPVINLGGIYPSKCYVRATTKARKVNVVINNKSIVTKEYPIINSPYYNSLSPHYAFLSALGGDYDGDKTSFTILYTNESIKEIDKIMNSKEFYISPDNELVFSPETDTLKYVVTSMNKGVIYA